MGNSSGEQKVPLKGLKAKPRRDMINYYDDVLAANQIFRTKQNGEHAMLPVCASYAIYLLDPACIPSPPSPNSSAYFFPWKRTPARVVLPSPFCFNSAALLLGALSRSTSLAGTLVTTFFPWMMLTSTLG